MNATVPLSKYNGSVACRLSSEYRCFQNHRCFPLRVICNTTSCLECPWNVHFLWQFTCSRRQSVRWAGREQPLVKVTILLQSNAWKLTTCVPKSPEHVCDVTSVQSCYQSRVSLLTSKTFFISVFFFVEIRPVVSAQEKESQRLSPSNSFFKASCISQSAL